MTASWKIGIHSMPGELWDQILQNVPFADLPNVMLSSQAFHTLARPHLYRSIYHFVGNSIRPPVRRFLLRSYNRAYDLEYNAKIVRLDRLLRTITEMPSLQACIKKIALSILGSCDDTEKETLKQFLSILHPNTLGLALVYDHANLALMSTVTSLDFAYPGEEELEYLLADQKYSHRDQIYSIFIISTLRHFSLRDARFMNVFGLIPDNTRVGTSNVVSLSLPNTVPMDVDLKEILTWPKGLKYIHHYAEPMDNLDFYPLMSFDGEMASAALFLQGIASQKASLEEVGFSNKEDRCGSDGSIFSPDLLREFQKLKRLIVPENCFIRQQYVRPRSFYRFLPSSLEEFYLIRYTYDNGFDFRSLPDYLPALRDSL